ncbi:hypothetical protein CRE_01304 [Caenorhabditis remanei]|uniref:Uncharacterized protein n=1 Tax=Caenorhabditis remanei TaxID=31234 RepID=E3N9K7_CAERE|nr:hypothetical protein CRE_01304 [Caenorhabditis remanei]
MDSQELLTFLQSPQVMEQIAKLEVARDNAIRAQLSGDQTKMQEFESQYVAFMEHYKSMCMTMGALVEERDFLKKQHAAIQSTRQEFESREAELVRKLDENTAKRDLIMEKDVLKRSDEVQIQTTKEDAERIRELQEYAKAINDKYLEFQTLGSKVTPYQKRLPCRI